MPQESRAAVLARRFQRQAANRDQATIGILAKEWLRIEDTLNEDLIATMTTLQDQELVTANQVFKAARTQELIGQVSAQTDLFLDEADSIIDAGTRAEMHIAREQQAEMMREMSKKALRRHARAQAVRGTFSQFPASQVKSMLSLTQGGGPLRDLFDGATPQGIRGMLDKMVEGLAKGENPRRWAPKVWSEGFSKGLPEVERTMRDQYNRAYRTAGQQTYRDSGLVQKYVRIAAKQERTCTACLALDGTIYETETLMELHPQDRCAMIPIVDGFDPPTFETGEDWLKRQSPKKQKATLGPLYPAYKEGVPIKSMVSYSENKEWGTTARSMSAKKANRLAASRRLSPNLAAAGETRRLSSAVKHGTPDQQIAARKDLANLGDPPIQTPELKPFEKPLERKKRRQGERRKLRSWKKKRDKILVKHDVTMDELTGITPPPPPPPDPDKKPPKPPPFVTQKPKVFLIKKPGTITGKISSIDRVEADEVIDEIIAWPDDDGIALEQFGGQRAINRKLSGEGELAIINREGKATAVLAYDKAFGTGFVEEIATHPDEHFYEISQAVLDENPGINKLKYTHDPSRGGNQFSNQRIEKFEASGWIEVTPNEWEFDGRVELTTKEPEKKPPKKPPVKKPPRKPRKPKKPPAKPLIDDFKVITAKLEIENLGAAPAQFPATQEGEQPAEKKKRRSRERSQLRSWKKKRKKILDKHGLTLDQLEGGGVITPKVIPDFDTAQRITLAQSLETQRDAEGHLRTRSGARVYDKEPWDETEEYQKLVDGLDQDAFRDWEQMDLNYQRWQESKGPGSGAEEGSYDWNNGDWRHEQAYNDARNAFNFKLTRGGNEKLLYRRHTGEGPKLRLNKTKALKKSPTMSRRVEASQADLEGMLSPNIRTRIKDQEGRDRVSITMTKQQRSFQKSQGGRQSIHMNVRAANQVVTHEYGHYWEEIDPRCHRQAIQFLEHRTKGEPVRHMGSGYRDSEITKKDKFLSAYMGKQYTGGGGGYGGRWKDPGPNSLGDGFESQDFPYESFGFRSTKKGMRPVVDHNASEIVSMGLQELVVDPGRMMMEDPEYFNFMMAIINE